MPILSHPGSHGDGRFNRPYPLQALTGIKGGQAALSVQYEHAVEDAARTVHREVIDQPLRSGSSFGHGQLVQEACGRIRCPDEPDPNPVIRQDQWTVAGKASVWR